MSPALEAALKKALIAALAAGVTVFLQEFPREQERLAAQSGGRSRPGR